MPPAYSFVGAGEVMGSWSPHEAIAQATAATAAAEATLRKLAPGVRHRLYSEVTVSGRLAEVVGDRASFADLVVVAAPRSKAQAALTDAVVEAALFGGRATVLFGPESAAPERIAKPSRVVVGWNQSAEPLRAAKCALPLLQGGAKVDVTVIDPQQVGTERSDPGGALCQYLARQAVKVAVTVLKRSQPKISQVLSDHVMDIGADLLVIGAYSHSRLREAILGGATRDLLRAGKIAVLMAH